MQFPRIYRPSKTDRYGPRTATEVKNAESGLELREQIPGMGACAAAIEKLLEFFAISHGVTGCFRCLVSHGYPLPFMSVGDGCQSCFSGMLHLCNGSWATS